MNHVRLGAHCWSVRIVCALTLATALVQVPGHARQSTMSFEPGWEGEIWQALPKFGHAIPCDFGPDGDIGGPLPSTCAPNLTLETLRHPTDVAIYQNPNALLVNGFPVDPLDYRLYVTDHWNNRVVMFVPDPNAADDNPTDGYGWRPHVIAGADWDGVTPLGNQSGALPLGRPDSIAIDDAGFVYVSDRAYGRVAVFDADGNFQQSLAVGELLYGIDVLPGTRWNETGTVAVLGIDEASGDTSVIFFSTGGADTGQQIGRYDAPALDTQPGSLVLSAGLAYDGPNRLVIADYGASRVKVFQTTDRGVIVTPVNELLNFGRPVNFGSPLESELQSPYSVEIDSRGRLLVGDTDNQRLVVYQPDYMNNTVQYLFQLNANGGLNGYPRGMVEDASGRLIIVDTGNHEVEVFQIPALAVVDVTVQGPRANAPQVIRPDAIVNSTFVPGDVVTVQFNVVAPQASGQVTNVFPTCSAVTVGNPDPAAQPTPVGAASDWPKLVSWTPTTLAAYQVLGAQSVGAIRSMGVTGDAYRFECQFIIQESGQVGFELGAESRDSSGAVLLSADRKAPVAPVGCGECETEPPTVSGQVMDPGPREFYNTAVTFSITGEDLIGPVDPDDVRRSLDPSGVRRLYWKWTMGPLVFWDPNFAACPEYPGTNIQCTDAEVDGSGNYPPSFTVPLFIDPYDAEGWNIIEFWAMDAVGNTTERKVASLAFDGVAPYPLFDFPTPTGPCWHDAAEGVNHCWYNSPISVGVNRFDNMTPSSQIVLSGASAPLQFSTEGMNDPIEMTLTDLVGNARTTTSSNAFYNGRMVHIDSVKPVTTTSAVGGDVQGNQVTLQLAASDEGSGLLQTLYTLTHGDNVFGPTAYDGGDITFNGYGLWTLSFWSTDVAGNIETPTTLTFYLNAPPVANNDVATGTEDVPQVINVLANDTDANGVGTLSIVTVTQPATLGSVATDGAAITFTPTANQHGSTSFTYTIADGHGQEATATVAVTVTPANDAPVAAADAATTAEDTPLGIAAATLLLNDTDIDGDALTVSAASGAVNGVVQLTGGTVTFAPAPNYVGPASFTYTVRDPGGLTHSAIVSVTVTAVADAPTAVDDQLETAEDTPLTIPAAALAANDVDPDGDAVTVTSVGSALNGTVTLDGGNVTFVPAAHFAGTASFTYTITDTANLTDTASVVVTVSARPDAPAAVDDVASTFEDTPVILAAAALLANDTDADGDGLSISAVGGAVNGAVELIGSDVHFTPASNFAGAASFTYTVTDGHGGVATALVVVTVAPVNDPPVANPDAATAFGTTPVVIDALVNDTDLDSAHSDLHIVQVWPASGGGLGTITIAPDQRSLIYTPNAAVDASDSYIYILSDGIMFSQARVQITLRAIANNAPVCSTAFGGEIWPPNHKRFFAAPIYGVTDPDGDAVSIRILGVTQDEPLDTTGDGRFAPDAQITNNDVWVRAERVGSGNGRVYEIQFEATDQAGATCTSSVFWTVPKSQGQPHHVIDSGVRYNSLTAVPGTNNKTQLHK